MSDNPTLKELIADYERFGPQAALSWYSAAKEAVAEIDRLKGRNADNPIARLHNICDALSEDAKESPFSMEEWNRVDAEQVRLGKENKGLRARIAELEKTVWNEAQLFAQRIAEMEAKLAEEFSMERFDSQVGGCYICGYNGERYYQPDTHPCAAKYHEARKKEQSWKPTNIRSTIKSLFSTTS